ncbi:hypothetical protein GH740_02330 [Microbacterium sp. SYP-A9085]|uniref:hypothetical protein n=1 Tax=Microbacterium sp. SYP-A9085 TaxID=2664454 RepID=UPI00129B2117|nr:hypothetical protein [Microbacterium sp. SYP-A9085]MRH28150.1 hypothetical protein [Microbacterium sp. SYP-A9085]
MEFYIRDGEDAELLPDWDIYACDAFGRPTHLIGGVIGIARTHEDALAVFVSMNPEYRGEYVHVRRSTIVPPWPTVGGV